MNLPFGLRVKREFSLAHAGDCTLLGVTPDGVVYVEELYGDGAWLAQHIIGADGHMTSSDEKHGSNIPISPIRLSPETLKPSRVWQTMWLNFSGARHRGLREADRVDAVVKPISIAEKVMLAQRLQLPVAAPAVLGLAESYVLAEADVIRKEWMVVCRRLRFAYALPTTAIDDEGLPYDYDTRVLHVVHAVQRGEEEKAAAAWKDGLPNIEFYRPMDCEIVGDHLYIADAGDESARRVSRVVVIEIERAEKPSPDDTWRKKLYG